MSAPKLIMQTTYAELLERCANAAFSEAFAEDGTFIAKTVKDRRYWYFQAGTGESRTQKYVGPETPELSERIARHRELRDDLPPHGVALRDECLGSWRAFEKRVARQIDSEHAT